MQLSLAAVHFSKVYRAAERLKDVLQRFVCRVKAKRHSAAVLIQNASRCRTARIILNAKQTNNTQLLLEREMAAARRKEVERQNQAATVIGKTVQGRNSMKKARGVKDQLLKERDLRNAEHKAAITMQAVGRGRLALIFLVYCFYCFFS